MRPFSARRALVVLAVAVVGASGVGSANALSTTVTDPVDSPANADVHSARFGNAELTLTTTVAVRSLQRAGRMAVTVTVPNTKPWYLASVWVRQDGTLGKQLDYHDGATTRRSCAMTASWSTSTDTIRLQVPQSCLAFGRYVGSYALSSRLTVGSTTDSTTPVLLSRGDTPDCATADELSQVHRGDSMARVHMILDMIGVSDGGSATTVTRFYQECGGPNGWTVRYEKSHRTVLSTQRVG